MATGSAPAQPRAQAAAPWRFVVVDEHGEPTAARLTLRSLDGGALRPSGLQARRDFDDSAYFYTQGRFQLEGPLRALELTLHKGFAYRPQRLRLERSAGDVRLALERAFDPAALGLYSGDGHVHPFSLRSLRIVENAAIRLQMDAEDLDLANLLAGNLYDARILAADRVHGGDEPESDASRILHYSEEYRADLWGHLVTFGVQRLSDPLFTSFADTPYPHDFPLNLDALAKYRAQGAFASFAHLRSELAQSVGFPIDVALGGLRAIEVQGYAVRPSVALPIWEHILDCGYDVVLTAGTDVMLDGLRMAPLGGARSYVDLGGAPLGYARFQQQLAAGRSFTTNGPLLFLRVAGRGPGERIELKPGGKRTLEVEIEVWSLFPWSDLVLRSDQREVARFHSDPAQPERQRFRGRVEVEGPGWIYARLTGPPANHLPAPMGGALGVQAISNPVWIDVPGRERRRAASIDYFRSWIARVRRVLEARDRFAAPAQREQAFAILDRADRHFAALAGGPD